MRGFGGMSDWQPIETAPKDGTCILVWSAEPGYECVELVSWAEDEPFGTAKTWATQSEGPGYSHEVESVTHWMPLPAPPA